MSKVAEVLLALLKAYSPTGREKNAERVLIEVARGLGLEAHSDGVGNVIASKGDSCIMLLGHYDTVPGKLRVSVRKGTVSGRGAVDAKGPLAAMLVAASLSERPVRVAAVVGEEGDSRGVRELLRGELPPYVIVGEPTNTVGVAIEYRGGAKLILRCRASGGHSSSPGDSAIEKLISCLERIQGSLKGIEGVSLRPTVMRGGEYENVLPRRAECTLDLRFPVGHSLQEILERIEIEDGCDIILKGSVDPVSVRPTDPVPRALTRAIITSGAKPILLRKLGSSDMNHISNYVRSCAAYGPGDSSLAHTDRERIQLKDLEFSVAVYKKAIEMLSDSFSSIEATHSNF
ncbi:M20/M25/M40 family metallo-hydrolase [Candidatus Korarchaeum cryptofilum]|uniref:Putative [LysW]-lysine/[LysW]-ornithine hydrolase n=1 Tax=Candidatus Korarchaeum cryptofilum TaxID=498846 RepID=A0A3R9RHL3_9CREN|nr:M20/M25/M40 family metallo-hydrolase [Candidatus Korarchaeum cryptofilum]RSN67484.1 M20/M25/M40 family metallo-hydrolase [Candidatus Korarchaeum cryptofilum]